MKESLSTSEWSWVAIFVILMASLVAISKVNAARAQSAISQAPQNEALIQVIIDGSVKKAGQYRVPEGSPVYAVLRKAQPYPWADLKALPLQDPITESLHIYVPELEKINVVVEGEVLEPVNLEMPARSRLADLKSKIRLTRDADKSFLNRRRLLRDGEKIEVPKKKLERNN